MGSSGRQRTKSLRNEIRTVSGEMAVFRLKNCRGEIFHKQFAPCTWHIMRTNHKGARMFKRTIQLNVVKKSKNRDETAEEPVYTAEDYANMVSQGANKAAFLTVKIVGSYMLLDTVRKIAVNRLSK